MATQNTAYAEIEARREQLTALAAQLWEQPEIYGHETFACEQYCRILEQEGFTVERGVSGIETAFRAQWGAGRPHIGFLAEYDALPQMSQKVATHREPVQPGGNGHGCGHNLIGVGLLGAALGMKREMEQSGRAGTLVFYGCPAEEQYIGKVFMARGGCFRDLDMAFSFHPGRFNGVFMRSMCALDSVHYVFHGKTAHSCIAPQSGNSALDAVELMNTSANYLREHVGPNVRFPYVITNGGSTPSVVPDEASSWYLIVAPTRAEVDEIREKLATLAQSAAQMTGTTVDILLESACYPTIYNEAISQVMQEVLEATPAEPFTPEELAFAHELNASLPAEWDAACDNWKCPRGTDLYEGTLPYEKGLFFGSTDIGDVSFLTPTVLLYTTCVNVGAPIHSWQATACAGSSIGIKGAIHGAKVIAQTGLRLLDNPEVLRSARAELDEVLAATPYACAVPDDVPVYQVRDLLP